MQFNHFYLETTVGHIRWLMHFFRLHNTAVYSLGKRQLWSIFTLIGFRLCLKFIVIFLNWFWQLKHLGFCFRCCSKLTAYRLGFRIHERYGCSSGGQFFQSVFWNAALCTVIPLQLLAIFTTVVVQMFWTYALCLLALKVKNCKIMHS